MPSKSESFGLVYLEAWNYSKPVIGCRIKAVTELIFDGHDGLLVEYGNISTLSNALIKLLQNNELCIQIGQNGKEKLSQFNLSKSCETFEKICHSIIKNST